jgi:hypothetical protein
MYSEELILAEGEVWYASNNGLFSKF